MTIAPPILVSDRKLLLTHLDMHPGKAVNADLDPAEVGIVGDTSHVQQGNSYHLGTPEQSKTGYAATESPRDKAGLNQFASALDAGWFEWRNPETGQVHNLRTFSAWCVRQCEANTPDSRDIREIIYSLDGKTVKRWDRLKRRSTGDTSHRTHTHFSLFRDAVKAGRGLTALIIRYLTEIGLLAPAPAETTKRKVHKMFPMLFLMKGDTTVWLSEMTPAGRVRVPLSSPAQRDALIEAGATTPMPVADEAELTYLGGPARVAS